MTFVAHDKIENYGNDGHCTSLNGTPYLPAGFNKLPGGGCTVIYTIPQKRSVTLTSYKAPTGPQLLYLNLTKCAKFNGQTHTLSTCPSQAHVLSDVVLTNHPGASQEVLSVYSQLSRPTFRPYFQNTEPIR